MRTPTAIWLAGLVTLLGLAPLTGAEEKGAKKVTSPLDFKMTGLDGKAVDLAQFKGKVVVFVNVASECGYTPQYKGLQEAYRKYAKDGLVIVGVPSNEFGGQEPGTSVQIQEFCKKNYGVEFPMLAKVKVNGKDACPLYQFLTSKETDPNHSGAIRWNFEKFVIGRNGQVAARFASDVEPGSDTFQQAIREQLAKK
jgi:glutathione peroxidase